MLIVNAMKTKIVILLSLLLVLLPSCSNSANEAQTTISKKEQYATLGTEVTADAENYTELPKDSAIGKAGDSINILSIGNSDGVLSLLVQNISDKDIEYLDITGTVDGYTACFTLSVLPSGEKAYITEKNNMKFSDEWKNAAWSTSEEIYFDNTLDTASDKLEITFGDGVVTVKNISDTDITGTIYICYKHTINDGLDGSVSYRMKLDSVKVGETKELYTDNANVNCTVVYVIMNAS